MEWYVLNPQTPENNIKWILHKNKIVFPDLPKTSAAVLNSIFLWKITPKDIDTDQRPVTLHFLF